MGFETPLSPQEMAKINRERMRSDEGLEKGGAEVKYDQKGEIIDLKPTEEQRQSTEEMMHFDKNSEIDELVKKESSLYEKIRELPDDEFNMVHNLEIAFSMGDRYEKIKKETDLTPREEKLIEFIRAKAGTLIDNMHKQLQMKYPTESEVANKNRNIGRLAEQLFDAHKRLENLRQH